MKYIIADEDIDKLGKQCECSMNYKDICPCDTFKKSGDCICNVFIRNSKNEIK